MTAVVGLLALFLAKPVLQAKAFSVTLPAAPAAKLVPQLGAQLGLRLKTEGPIGKEVLILCTHEISSKEILKRIAEVSGGEWRETNTSLVLQDSIEARRKNREAVRASRTATFQRELKKLCDDNSKRPTYTSAEALLVLSVNPGGALDYDSMVAAKGADAGSPQNKVLAAILSKLPSDVLSGADPAEVVFSTAPVGDQQAMPAGVNPLIIQYLHDQRELMDKVEQTAEYAKIPRPRWTIGPDPQTSFSKAVLSFRPGDFYGGWEAKLCVYGTDMKLIRRATYQLREGARPEQDAEIPADDLNPPGEFALGLEFAEKRYGNRAHERTEADTARLKRYMAQVENPEQFEPLQFALGDLLLAWAERSRQNVVGDLSDGVFSEVIRTRSHLVHLGSLLGGRFEQASFSDGWLSLTPKDLEACRQQRIDREALGRLCRSIAKDHVQSYDETLQYAMSRGGSEMPNAFELYYTRSFSPRTTGEDGWSIYRFLGGLAPSLRQALFGGKPLSISSLSESSRSALVRLATSWRADIMFASAAEQKRQEESGAYSGWDELLTEGLDPKGVIQAKSKSFEVAQAYSNKDYFCDTVSPREASWEFAGPGHPFYKGYDTFAPAVETEIQITVNALPGVSFRMGLIRDDIKNGATFGGYASLPESFRREVEKESSSAGFGLQSVETSWPHLRGPGPCSLKSASLR